MTMPNSRAHSSQSVERVQEKNSSSLWSRPATTLTLIVIAYALLAFAFRNPFVGQWDSFDYITKTVHHEISDLAFGRPAFLAIDILVWDCAHHFGVQAPDFPQIAQAFVLAFGLLGLVTFYFCVKPIGGKSLALIGVAWLATTPMYVAYSGLVMTEVPSLTCLMASLAFVLRWERTEQNRDLIWSALLFAAGVHMREQLITAAGVFPFLVLLNRRISLRRRGIAFALHTMVASVAIIGVLFGLGIWDKGYWGRVVYWYSVVRLVHQDLWRQLYFLAKFSLANSLLALIVAVATFRRWSRVIPARAVAMGMGFLPLFALLPNGDLGIQPRYEIIAVPAMIVAALMGLKQIFLTLNPSKRKMLVTALVGCQILLLIAGMVRLTQFNRLSQSRKVRMEALLKTAPENAVFIGGAYTPVVEFYRQTGERPDWEIIRSGWEWPGKKLRTVVEQKLEERRPVFLLTGEGVWDFLKNQERDVDALRSQFRFVPIDPGEEQVMTK